MTVLSANNDDLIGLVLVGGKSSRMHAAKAHLMFGSEPLWQHCERALLSVCKRVFFSVSPQLSPPLPVEPERLIADAFVNPIGPLGGIISAFKHMPSASLFVMACDMPHADENAVRWICEHRARNQKATVFALNDHVDPLFGIYETSIMPDLVTAWASDVLCPRKILSTLEVERLTPPEPAWLTNINHAHEYATLKEALATKFITVHYYAGLREAARMHQEMLKTSATTVGEIYGEARRRHGFTYDERFMRFAKNNQLVGPGELVDAHDTIVFIPPVSGG